MMNNLLVGIYALIRRNAWIGDPIDFPMHTPSSYDGVFSFLRTDGNPANLHIIDLITSSTNTGAIHSVGVEHILEPDTWLSSRWASLNQPDQYVIFDFKCLRMSVSAYAIRCSQHSHSQPRNWNLEVSNTGRKWARIDSVVDFGETAPMTQGQYNFALETQSRPYRYIRFKSTGLGAGNNNYLVLSGVEFFGSLHSSLVTKSLHAIARIHRVVMWCLLFDAI